MKREALESRFYDVVIIAPACVDGDSAVLGLTECRVRVLRRPVIHAEDYHGLGLGPERARIGALVGARRDPAHVAVIAARQILREMRARLLAQRGGGEAHRIEAERKRLLADRCFGVRGHPRPR
jgi:hypothetical protein